jgi:hypothetical protein
MPEDAHPDAEPQPEASAALDPAQVAEKLRDFESRIRAGDYDHGGFHRAVQQDLFPLLGEGALQSEAFKQLVTLWALRNHPFDWPLKPFGRLN